MGVTPHISVIICTRNRPADVQRCLASLTTVLYPHWDILLVDQSVDRRTERVAHDFMAALPNLMYLPMDERGLSRARNAGVAASSGEIVAFLDDDCTVEADWLEQVACAFQRHPDAALVFGSFEAIAHDQATLFIPSYTVEVERTLQGRRALTDPGGFGGSMYLRRALAEQVGPFDVHLGAGTHFASNEDRDYSLRAILLGYSVVETPAIVVQHYGARNLQSGELVRLVRDCLYSQGALHMKLLRAGNLAALWVIAVYSWRNVANIKVRNLLLLRRPNHLREIIVYMRGLLASFQLTVDRQTCLYTGVAGRPVARLARTLDQLVGMVTATGEALPPSPAPAAPGVRNRSFVG